MKVLCERDKLLAAFQAAAAVAPSRSPKPILQNVKFEVTSDGATMMATDLEIGVRATVEGVDVTTPGSVVLPVDGAGAILRESIDAKLRVESDDRGTLVRGERSEFRLLAEDPNEFPSIATFGESKYHVVRAGLLKQLIGRTAFATDNESSRYALGGVLLEMHGETITAVATDGRRLAKMEGPAQVVGDHSTADRTTIVPTKAMHLVERALTDADADVWIATRSNDILFKTPRTTIYARLVEGRYPRWRDVFPSADDVQRVELAVGPFYSAVRQAMIVTSGDSRGVDFVFSDGKVTLTGRSSDKGESRIEVPIAYEGPTIGIMLDPRFLSEFLRVLDGESTFTLQLHDSETAALAKTDDGYMYVIMPLAREQEAAPQGAAAAAS